MIEIIANVGRWEEHHRVGGRNDLSISKITTEQWENIRACVCKSCHHFIIELDKVPPYSLMGGYDFGNMEYVYSRYDLYALTPPTELEMQVLAKYRLYCEIIKLVSQNPDTSTKQSRLVGHVVVLPSDGYTNAADTLAKSLPCIDGVNDFVKVFFVGTREEWTTRKENIMNQQYLTPHFAISRKNTLSWLMFIKAVNPEYREIIGKMDWNDDDFQTFRKKLIDETEVSVVQIINIV